MFNVDEVLAELAAGRSIEVIAQDAADVLNAAKQKYDEEIAAKKEAERKAREEKKKAAAALLQKKRKMNSATAIVNSLFDYMNEFYPGFFSEEEITEFQKTFDASALVDAIDETVNIIKDLPNLNSAIIDAGKQKNDSIKDAEDAINKFLRENNLF